MKIQSVKVKEIPVPAKFKHPPAPNPMLPNHEFTMGLIAPKGSGKTTLICNLLEFYKGYFHNIYVFSPTVLSDEKWDYIKKLPLLVENKSLKKFLKEIKKKKESENKIVQTPPEVPIVPEFEEEFDPHIPEDCFIADFNIEDIRDMMDSQMKMVRFLKKHKQSKHLANRVLFVFDDMVGSELFAPSKSNPFRTFNSNHRHYSFSCLLVSQFYREIQKLVRVNFSALILFEIPNEKELEVIYEENPVGLTRKEWDAVYHHCVDEDYSFMFINFQKPKRLRISKKFDSYVILKDA